MSAPHYRSNMPKLKACNALNQAALDHLYDLSQKPRYSSSKHYPRLFVKAMQSLSKCPLHISSFKDATSLSGVGNFLAREIMNAVGDTDKEQEVFNTKDNNDQNSNAKAKKRKRARVKSASKTALTTNDRDLIRTSLKPSSNRANATKTNPVLMERLPVPVSTSIQSTTTSRKKSENCSNNSVSQRKEISKKEKAYIQSTNEAVGILTNINLYKNWKIVLLLDQREHHANAVQSRLLQYGLDCEQRQLPIADVLWIARGELVNKTTVQAHILPEKIEIVLGTLIERKSLSDLASSLYGTRFEEQRLRLKHSHSAMDCENQVIFLVEGININDIPNCPAATLKYAMMSTRVHMGFQIVRTKNLDDTCRMLRRIHRRMMVRTFPNEIQLRRSQKQDVLRSKKKRRNRRLSHEYEDCLEESFQSIPKIPFERTRHYLYSELKTKIELDRERGTKSIHAIFRAQLKQVEGMSIKKVDAVSRLYRTPRDLIDAYDGLQTVKECEKMVEDIPLGIRVERSSRVGPKCSIELSHVYTKGGPTSKWSNEDEHVFQQKTGIHSRNKCSNTKASMQIPSNTMSKKIPKIANAEIRDADGEVDTPIKDNVSKSILDSEKVISLDLTQSSTDTKQEKDSGVKQTKRKGTGNFDLAQTSNESNCSLEPAFREDLHNGTIFDDFNIHAESFSSMYMQADKSPSLHLSNANHTVGNQNERQVNSITKEKRKNREDFEFSQSSSDSYKQDFLSRTVYQPRQTFDLTQPSSDDEICKVDNTEKENQTNISFTPSKQEYVENNKKKNTLSSNIESKTNSKSIKKSKQNKIHKNIEIIEID